VTRHRPGGRGLGQGAGRVRGWLLVVMLLAVVGGALWLWFGPPRHDGRGRVTTARDDSLPPGEAMSIWFASLQEDALVSEQRRVAPGLSPSERAKAALQELIAGPKGEALRTLPAETKVRELFLDGQGTAYADFTEALSRNHPGGVWCEILTVRSIVQTLAANVPEIKQVQILIEGREVETLAGHIDIRRPFATTWAIDQR
jgi:spore germination protein GerM